MSTPTSKIPKLHHLNWRVFAAIGVALGVIIAVSVVYLAVNTHQAQNVRPAYYSQMAGNYSTVNGVAQLELKETGEFYSNLRFFTNGTDSMGVGGKWSVRGDVLILDTNSGADNGARSVELNISADGLYAPNYGLRYNKP